jgi:hypothetical protein
MSLQMRKYLLLAAMVAVPALSANAQQSQPPLRPPPNRTDLSAAYCIEATIQATSGVLAAGEGATTGKNKLGESERAARRRLDRLKAYITARMPQVDGSALLVEMNRAKDDATQAAQLAESCRKTCAGASACVDRCLADKETVKRLRGCNDLRFLPR